MHLSTIAGASFRNSSCPANRKQRSGQASVAARALRIGLTNKGSESQCPRRRNGPSGEPRGRPRRNRFPTLYHDPFTPTVFPDPLFPDRALGGWRPQSDDWRTLASEPHNQRDSDISAVAHPDSRRRPTLPDNPKEGLEPQVAARAMIQRERTCSRCADSNGKIEATPVLSCFSLRGLRRQ